MLIRAYSSPQLNVDPAHRRANRSSGRFGYDESSITLMKDDRPFENTADWPNKINMVRRPLEGIASV